MNNFTTFVLFILAMSVILLGVSNIMTQQRLNAIAKEPNKTYIIKLQCPEKNKK